MPIILDTTTRKLQALTGAAVSTDYIISIADVTSTTHDPSPKLGNIATATTSDIVAAPASSHQILIITASFRNRSTTATQTLTVIYNDNGTSYRITPEVQLLPGECLNYADADGWSILDSAGRKKIITPEQTVIGGRSEVYLKQGLTVAEAVGRWMCTSKDGGSPGAWATGSPGLNGRTCDGTTSTDAGCISWINPASGSQYLVGWSGQAAVSGLNALIDFQWVNTGLTVTTTTNQAITSGAMPARDSNGTVNGLGNTIWLLVTTVTTNAGAITNMTVSYTNSDGTAGRTATCSSFPATAVVGTIVPFALQAGDRGVKSIEGITLGTSLVTGAVSLVVGRLIASLPITAANTSNKADLGSGIRCYDGTCLILAYLASATTANDPMVGTLAFVNR